MLQDIEILKTLMTNAFIFSDRAIVLCFTHIDVFVKKIQRVPLTIAFPDYKGVGDRRAIEYIINKFREVIPHNKVYPVVVNTMDSNDVAMMELKIRKIIMEAEDKEFAFTHHKLCAPMLEILSNGFWDIDIVTG